MGGKRKSLLEKKKLMEAVKGKYGNQSVPMALGSVTWHS